MIRSRSIAQLLSLLSVLIFLAACGSEPQKPAPPPDTRKADEAAIRAASADWSKATQARDLDKFVSFYADDAVYFVSNGALVKGKDKIKMAWQPTLASQGTTLSFDTTYVEVARSGDLAYEYGTYTIVTEAKKGKPTEEKGKYVVVWKKQPGGTWKAVADIGNVGL
jgi:uncharacterized protein (TIGR02246 family)